jgi:nucleoside-diphosphate-sugar epimerase
MNPARDLVTGGTGVLGRRVVECLGFEGVRARVFSRGGRPGANRRRHRSKPARGCSMAKDLPAPESFSPASILPCMAFWSRWSIASGVTKPCTSS